MDPSYYMEVAMEKGARSYLGLVFALGRMQAGMGRKQICLGRM